MTSASTPVPYAARPPGRLYCWLAHEPPPRVRRCVTPPTDVWVRLTSQAFSARRRDGLLGLAATACFPLISVQSQERLLASPRPPRPQPDAAFRHRVRSPCRERLLERNELHQAVRPLKRVRARLEIRDVLRLLRSEIGDDEVGIGLRGPFQMMKSVVHGLSRDAECLADVGWGCPQLARLEDARGLQLIEVTPETADRLERLEGQIRRFQVPNEPARELHHLHRATVRGQPSSPQSPIRLNGSPRFVVPLQGVPDRVHTVGTCYAHMSRG
jgi:hypothetical protein